MSAADPHLCSACTRFIADHLECPYCGSDSIRRPFLQALRLAAFTLTGTGFLILGLLAGQTTPPRLHVTALRPAMNHARVTLAGTISRAPQIIRPSQGRPSYSFELSDTGGRISVMVPAGTAEPLLAHPFLPAMHDRLQVTGRLYLVSGQPPRLYLDSAPSVVKL